MLVCATADNYIRAFDVNNGNMRCGQM
ncbi:PQQ-binding-like beta-propeller repeat protein [Caballeronia arationis]